MRVNQDATILFLHGRPGPHPFHGRLATSVHASLQPVDWLVRYHDRPSNRIRRYVSWALNGVLLAHQAPHLIISEGLHVPPVLARMLRTAPGKRPAIAALMASETLYFIDQRRYSSWTCRWLVGVLARYDALLCIGDMQRELAESVLGARRRRTVSIPGAVSTERMTTLLANRPALDSKHIVCIANGPGGWRTWYKGIDLLLETFDRVSERQPAAHLTVAGEWEASAITGLVSRLQSSRDRVKFIGPQADVMPVLRDASLYMHLGRGDAFPLSVLEAMCAGVPAIVSEWTGTRQAVRQFDPTMVVPLDARAAAARAVAYLEGSHESRSSLAEAARSVGRTYTDARATRAFDEAVAELRMAVKKPSAQ